MSDKKPGPTGEEEGQLRIGVTTYKDNVIIDFGAEVAWIAMLPEQAIELAETIKSRAEVIIDKKKDSN